MHQDGPTVPILGQQPLVPAFGPNVIIATEFTAEGIAVPVEGQPLQPKRILLLGVNGAHNGTRAAVDVPIAVPEEMAIALRDALLDLMPPAPAAPEEGSEQSLSFPQWYAMRLSELGFTAADRSNITTLLSRGRTATSEDLDDTEIAEARRIIGAGAGAVGLFLIAGITAAERAMSGSEGGPAT